MHLRKHHQHEERHIIATRCMYFCSLFLVFFCVDDITANHPRSIQHEAPIV